MNPSLGGAANARFGTMNGLFRAPPVFNSLGLWRILRSAFAAGKVPDCDGTLLFSSGKAALLFALKVARKYGHGRAQVVVPAYTCYSVAASIEHAGLKMVTCDIDKNSLSYRLDELVGRPFNSPKK